MLRRIIGIVFIVAAAALTIGLLSRGGPMIPHIVGPVTLTIVGVALLIRRHNH